jgi:hypothetical protein
MHVAVADVVGGAMIATGAWRIARPLASRLLGRATDPEPGGWRNTWWGLGSVLAGVLWITGVHGLILWVGLGLLSVILVVTFPPWDPFSRARHRATRNSVG